jgi:PTH1 family peptidyl-tRNA hydrolase
VHLIIGLGNPGRRYEKTRHNMGFLVLDRLAATEGIPLKDKRSDSIVGRGVMGGGAVLLAKPQTFMNLSGQAVRGLFDYFRIATEDVIVVHDDLDLPFAEIRLKYGGGHGGHKGLISVMQHLGSGDFCRVRMGIGRPQTKEDVERYVLEPFAPEERDRLSMLLETAVGAIGEIVSSGIQTAMGKYNGKAIKNFKEEV